MRTRDGFTFPTKATEYREWVEKYQATRVVKNRTWRVVAGVDIAITVLCVARTVAGSCNGKGAFTAYQSEYHRTPASVLLHGTKMSLEVARGYFPVFDSFDYE